VIEEELDQIATTLLEKKTAPTYAKKVLSLVVFLFFTASTVLVFFICKFYIEKENKYVFTGKTKEIEFNIESKLSEYTHFLYNTRGFFYSSEEVTENEWHTYLEAQDAQTKFSVLELMGYAQRVEKNKMSSFLAQNNITLHPSQVFHINYPLTYIFPGSKRSLKGWNLSSNTLWQSTIDTAVVSNELASTGVIPFDFSQGRKEGICLFLPVFPSFKLSSVKKNPVGLLFAALDLQQILEESIIKETRKKSQIYVSLKEESSNTSIKINYETLPDSPRYTDTQQFSFGGKEWKLTFYSGEKYTASTFSSLAPYFLGLSVFLLGLLLSGLIYSVLKTSEKAVEIANLLKERFTYATKAAHIGVWTWDFNEKTFKVDSQMQTYFGLSQEKNVLGEEEWIALLSEKNKGEIRAMREIPAPSEELHFVQHLVIGNQERYLRSAGGTLNDSSGNVTGITGISWDITKEYESSIAKSEFVSFVAHELKNPLSTIKWSTELVLEEVKGMPEQVQEFPRMTLRNVHRMVALVNTLLNISRLELNTLAITPEKIELRPFLNECASLADQLVQERKLSFNLYIENIPEFYEADPVLMHILMRNVISNAAKYSAEGGMFSFFARTAKEGEDVDGKILESDAVLFGTENSGEGISAGEAPFVFAKNYRAKSTTRAEGHGLGLYLSKLIIDVVGGEMWFHSDPGEKTRFYILLPLHGMKKVEGSKKASLSQ